MSKAIFDRRHFERPVSRFGVWSVECPECGADVGIRCATFTDLGPVLRAAHRERWAAYRLNELVSA